MELTELEKKFFKLETDLDYNPNMEYHFEMEISEAKGCAQLCLAEIKEAYLSRVSGAEESQYKPLGEYLKEKGYIHKLITYGKTKRRRKGEN